MSTRRNGNWARLAFSAAGLAIFVLVWWILAERVDNINKLPRPLDLARQIWALTDDPELLRHLVISIRRVAIGFTLGAGVGVLSAILTVLSKRTELLLDSFVEALRPIPPLAVLPLLLATLGIGERLPILVVAFVAFFPTYVASVAGFRGVERVHIEAGFILGCSRFRLIRDIILPAGLPQVAAGLRVALGLSWMSIVAAEMIGTRGGIGNQILVLRQFFRTTEIVVGMLLIGMTGLILDLSVRRLSKAVMPWQTANRD